MKKKLPFVYPTIIDAFSGVAGNIAVELNYKSYLPLIVANHFLITYSYKLGHGGYNWDYYNDNYGHFVSMQDKVDEKGLINAIIDEIDSNHYVRLLIDYYYIKNSPWYQIEHEDHYLPQIIGYDDVKKVFFVADNFSNGKYEVIEVTFDEMILARKDIQNYLIQYSYFDHEIDYKLEKEHLFLLIRSYLDEKCYLANTKYDCRKNKKYNKKNTEVYGKIVYKILREQTDKMFEVQEGNFLTYQVWINHMSVTCLMLEVIRDNFNYLDDTKNAILEMLEHYKELEKKAISTRNLYIKLSLRKSEKTYEKVKEQLQIIEQEEIAVLNQLLVAIENIEEDNV